MKARIEAAYAAWRDWHHKRTLLWELGTVDHVIQIHI